MFSPQDIERLKRIHHLLKEKKMTIEGAQKAMRKRNIEAEKNDSDITLLEQLQSLRAMLVDMRNNMGEPLPEENIVEGMNVAMPMIEAPIAVDVQPEPVVNVQPEVETIEEKIEQDDNVVPAESIEATMSLFEVESAPVDAHADEVEQEAEVAVAPVEPEELVEPEPVVEPELVAEPEVMPEPIAEPQPEPANAELLPMPTVPTKPKKKRAPRRKLIGEEGVVERPLFPFYEQTLF
jgi:DNA-binding transcriptional MerR regulator